MIVSTLVALILSLFLIGMSAVFEMRRLNREIELLQDGIRRANQNAAIYKALAYDKEVHRVGEGA